MYNLDPQAARKADTIGAQIKEIGKYVGAFTQAEDIKTKKGGRGIAFNFVSEGGQKARLAIYTTMANGDKIGGFETLMAIMTCMSLRNIKPVPATVKHYDYDTKTEVEKDGSVFPELHKPIGILLETEDFEKQDGSIGTRMVLKNVFRPATALAPGEFTASEILDKKTEPVQLEKMVAALRHRPYKPKAGAPVRSAAPAGGGTGFEDMDDLIPFNDPMKSRAFSLCI